MKMCVRMRGVLGIFQCRQQNEKVVKKQKKKNP